MSRHDYFDRSRRNFLLGAGAGVSALAVPGIAGSASAAPLPLVKPLESHKVYSAFGVCALLNHGKTGYRYTDACLDALTRTGASYFRAMYVPGLAATPSIIQGARARGLKWGMQVTEDINTPADEIARRIRHIAANAADLCLYIEGINEPNYVRSTGATPSGWVSRTLTQQKAIWQAVHSDPRLSHVQVLGPSLQDVKATESDYKALANGGMLQYMDYAAIHRYPGGRYPDHLLDERLALIKRVWPGKRTWITETGYTNALATSGGHRPTPEDISAVYAPSALLEAVDRGCQVTWFELLDNPDAGAKDDIEANFGMFGTISGMAPPWRTKPVATTMKSFLDRLRDPGPGFSPASVPLRVTAPTTDIRRTLTAKRNGQKTLHLRRAKNAWDPIAQRRVSVPKVAVRVETSSGVRTVQVDHQVTSLVL